jgi:prepilin-type N-terminal cleavage/methylation domain-containing protein
MNAQSTFLEKRMTRGRAGSDAGFSLVEMLVAMTITLIVSGAIYGLLAGGQNAFRREPELTDRQQNIRLAMSVIMRDIANAGTGMPTFIQAFTRDLDACASCPDSAEDLPTDDLEMLSNTSARDNERVCNNPGNGSSVNVRLFRGQTELPLNTRIMIIFDDGTWTFRNVIGVDNPNTGAGDCTAGVDHVNADVRTGGDTSGLNTSGGVCQPSANGLGNAGGPTDCNAGTCGESVTACPNFPSDTAPCCTVVALGFGELIHYQVRNDASGVPVLQRFTSSDPTPQTLAYGIEDMKVRYVTAATPDPAETDWVADAPAVVPGTYTSLITQVRVTLVARSEARNIQGARTSESGRINIRGALTSTGTPRAALANLATDPATPKQWW